MKVINIKFVYLLLIMVTVVGCRTAATKIENKKDKAKLVWENQLPVDFNQFKKMPLHIAVEQGDIEEILNLSKGQASLEEKDQFGATPLQLATGNTS